MELPDAPQPRRRRWPIVLAISLLLALVVSLLAMANAKRRDERARGPVDLATLQSEIEGIRELEFRRPVTAEFLTSEEVAQEIREAVAAGDFGLGLPDGDTLAALGMIPEGTDLQELLTEAGAGSVVGFYDPETKRLVVQSSDGERLTPFAQTTLVHELTHAVTDQHFDLSRFLTGEEPDDELSARTAVAEGDATLAMALWGAKYLSVGDGIALGLEAVGDLGAIAEVPPALVDIMAFPYVEGHTFIQRLHELGGWRAVDRAYTDPPTTTEQVLHPERYLTRDRARDVEPPEIPPGTTGESTGQIGELFLREMLDLSTSISPDEAAGAAAGWDGGSYASFRSGTRHVVALAVAWDSTADATEFSSILTRWADRFGSSRCLDFEPGGAEVVSFTLATSGC
ncbi:MAG: hypothetical protein WD770_00495 [Actinomycetota bacterium]